jgi:PPOX class probable F420-dependent enzyme
MAMANMPEGAWREFVAGQPRTAKLATVRRDGSPHVAPVWVAFDGDEIVFTTGEATVKGRTIARDPRVAMCFDDERPPFSFVIVEGTARIVRDEREKLHWATRIAARYMGEDRAEAYGKRNAVLDELLIRVTPTRIVAQQAIAD